MLRLECVFNDFLLLMTVCGDIWRIGTFKDENSNFYQIQGAKN